MFFSHVFCIGLLCRGARDSNSNHCDYLDFKFVCSAFSVSLVGLSYIQNTSVVVFILSSSRIYFIPDLLRPWYGSSPIYIHTHIYVCTCMYIYTCTHAHMHIFIINWRRPIPQTSPIYNKYVHMCMCARTYIYIYIHAYICI